MPDPAVLSDAVFGRNTRYHFNYIPRGQPEKYGFFWLYQAGDLFATKGYRISQHIQICHEVSYIESGSGQFNINGKWFPAAI